MECCTLNTAEKDDGTRSSLLLLSTIIYRFSFSSSSPPPCAHDCCTKDIIYNIILNIVSRIFFPGEFPLPTRATVRLPTFPARPATIVRVSLWAAAAEVRPTRHGLFSRPAKFSEPASPSSSSLSFGKIIITIRFTLYIYTRSVFGIRFRRGFFLFCPLPAGIVEPFRP